MTGLVKEAAVTSLHPGKNPILRRWITLIFQFHSFAFYSLLFIYQQQGEHKCFGLMAFVNVCECFPLEKFFAWGPGGPPFLPFEDSFLLMWWVIYRKNEILAFHSLGWHMECGYRSLALSTWPSSTKLLQREKHFVFIVSWRDGWWLQFVIFSVNGLWLFILFAACYCIVYAHL